MQLHKLSTTNLLPIKLSTSTILLVINYQLDYQLVLLNRITKQIIKGNNFCITLREANIIPITIL